MIKKKDGCDGFVGFVRVYDEDIFINTNTGKGYDKVIVKMDKYIGGYASRIKLPHYDREDIKQLIISILLDGIKKYNHKFGIKLSTFLYIHIKNRIISRLKEEGKQSTNATANEAIYKLICSCGNIMIMPKCDDIICDACENEFNNTWKQSLIYCRPISLDTIVDENGYEYIDAQDNNNFVANVERKIDFIKLIKQEDVITKKIAEMVYFNDKSISDAAKEIGLSCWATSLRLKNMKTGRQIKDIFQ